MLDASLRQAEVKVLWESPPTCLTDLDQALGERELGVRGVDRGRGEQSERELVEHVRVFGQDAADVQNGVEDVFYDQEPLVIELLSLRCAQDARHFPHLAVAGYPGAWGRALGNRRALDRGEPAVDGIDQLVDLRRGDGQRGCHQSVVADQAVRATLARVDRRARGDARARKLERNPGLRREGLPGPL